MSTEPADWAKCGAAQRRRQCTAQALTLPTPESSRRHDNALSWQS